MKNIVELAGIFARIDSPELIRDLLVCILTTHELEEIDSRWELVKMLHKGVSQRKIAGSLNMSLCKITRGSKELHKENSAFKKVIENYLPR
jgi:TrpR family trp operon transcriptional repressor